MNLIEIPKCEVSKVGLKLDENLTFDEWKGIGLQLQTMQGSIGFWIGDWLNFGEKHYGETYTQAVEATGAEVQTLMNYKWVAKTIETSRRRDKLSFSAHHEIASAPVEKQNELLEQAETEKLSSRDIREKVKEIKKLPTPPLPKGKYDVIYCDPAWEYDNTGFAMSAEKQYPTMSIEKLKELGVESLSADNCVMFMWATNPLLKDAIDVMNNWGFEYKTNFVWTKTNHTAGFYVLGQHELLLIGIKGSKLPVERYKSIITGDNKVHSKKPEIVYEMIEKMYPNMKYVELFARNTKTNWESWGNQL